MTTAEVKALKPGDNVYWQDPDDGLCSRTLTIRTIDASRDDFVVIEDTEGDELWATPAELRSMRHE